MLTTATSALLHLGVLAAKTDPDRARRETKVEPSMLMLMLINERYSWISEWKERL